jgi:hypothetical protein
VYDTWSTDEHEANGPGGSFFFIFALGESLRYLFVRSRGGEAQAWHRKALSGHFKAHRFAGPWDHEGVQGVVFRYRSHSFEVEEDSLSS